MQFQTGLPVKGRRIARIARLSVSTTFGCTSVVNSLVSIFVVFCKVDSNALCGAAPLELSSSYSELKRHLGALG